MKVIFRTDASIQIGTGHVMRCLTLADALRKEGADCTFLCRAHNGHLLELIRQRGHNAILLRTKFSTPLRTQDTFSNHTSWLGTSWEIDALDTQQAIGNVLADWLIVDHYALDERWEKAMRHYCKQLMVIDDLADRPHDCDLLLDQNLGRTTQDYSKHISRSANVLLGPRYALLRPEFSALREKSLARRTDSQLKKFLITMGGVDKDNATTRVMQALECCDLTSSSQITVVMGLHAPWLTDVQSQSEKMPWPTKVLVNVQNMAELMAQSDLCIGAAGSTNWERCCLGLPCVLVVLAENQKSSSEALNEAGAVHQLDLASLTVSLPTCIENLKHTDALRALSTAAQAITKGDGAFLVTNYLINHLANVGESC